MKILLVDDEVEILKMLKRHLELEGFEVTAVSSPMDAIKEMENNLFNIAITDIRMPGMSGVELIKEFKSINPLANIIIITGYSNMSYMVDCLGGGAIDYFTKPFTEIDTFIKALKDTKDRVERWQTAMGSGGS